MDVLQIGSRVISALHPVFVIAEIGVNHDGSVERALELVDHAARAGADGVKLQIFNAVRLVHRSGEMAAYQKQRCQDSDPTTMLRKYELSAAHLARIVRAIRAAGLVPIATPFSPEDVAVLREMQLPAVKIASPDLVNYPLLKSAAGLGVSMLVSTGAANLDEIDRAAGWLRAWHASLGLLHCVSCYPVAVGDARLCWIGELRERYGVPVGYSDHTTEFMAGALAVAQGACVVEKHLTYDCTATGPDHAASADPEEFARYVGAIRLAERMRGLPGKRVLDIELDVRQTSRQSLVAARSLAAGMTLGEEDLTVQRPGTGLGAAFYPQVLGSRLNRAVEAGVMLQPDMLAR